jgi:hypothetical protein
MEILEELRKKLYPDILKKRGFQKKGTVWFKNLDLGVVLMVSSSVKSVDKTNFLYFISYGIYFNGVIEPMYGFPFKIETGIENALIKSSMNPLGKPSSWNFKPDSDREDFLKFVETFLLDKALPFLQKFSTPEDIADFLEPRVDKFLKTDSIVVLKLATLYFLIGQQKRAIELVEMAKNASKEPYVFAENLLDKFRNGL